MNTALTVKKMADINFVPIKYRVVEMMPRVATITGPADVTCVLEVVRVGWDTTGHYDDWISDRKPVGIQGAIGELSVAALSTLAVYTPLTPGTDV